MKFRLIVGFSLASAAAFLVTPDARALPGAASARKSAAAPDPDWPFLTVKAKPTSKPVKGDAESDDKAQDAKKSGKPVQVGSFGDWGAFLAQGAKGKTCYALAVPKDRAPGKLKRDPAYIFISSRPADNVHNEVSVIMGFSVKDGGEARAEIGGDKFDLIAKGANAWIKNTAEESDFIDALKKGSKLIVKAPSLKGNVTIDTYSLSGLSQALDKVQKDCP